MLKQDMKKDCPAGAVLFFAPGSVVTQGRGLPRPAVRQRKLRHTNAKRQVPLPPPLGEVSEGRCLHRSGNAQSQNCTIFGENAKRPVGADDPVRPWGNGKFTAMFRKNDCALCGESAASTPTNVVRIRRGTFVFAGACCRADRVVRPYGCVRVRMGASKFATSCRAGGASPVPALRRITDCGTIWANLHSVHAIQVSRRYIW